MTPLATELTTFLPWGTLLTMGTMLGYVIRLALVIGKLRDQAERADERSKVTEKRQSAFELEVSKTYVPHDALRIVSDKIDRLGERLGDRIDRAVENASAARKTA